MKQSVPSAILAQHLAVLGKTGSGKTSTAKLAIEQVVADGARVCVLDPIKSDWWGLTSSADGRRAGLPFHILGGPHGHVPLHASAGKAVAEIVASGALPLSIIDMAEFEPGGQAKFFVDFAPALLRKIRGVVYLVIEEAHLFAPKERSGIGAENLSIHWAKTLATAGRSKGVRLVILTQRTQALHNAVLGSCDTIIVHRLTAPADQEPVIKWLKTNVQDKAIQKQVTEGMSSLTTGSGWVCSGEAKIFELIHFPRIATYDNTATPTGDGETREVKTAPVDREKLHAIIGDAVEKAKADDPRELRKQLAEANRMLVNQAKTIGDLQARTPAAKEKVVEKPVLKDAQIAALDKVLGRLEAAIARAAETLTKPFAGVREQLGALTAAVQSVKQPSLPLPPSAATRPMPHAPVARPMARPLPPSAGNGDGHIAPAKQKILNALAFFVGIGVPQVDKTQLALMVGVSPTSGGYFNNLGALRSYGLIHYPTGGTVALTDSGAAAASTDGVPTTTDELHDAVRAKLPPAKWKILDVLIRAYPEAVSKDDLAKAIDVSPTSGGYFNNLGSLRTLGLVDYPVPGSVAAQPVLFLEAR